MPVTAEWLEKILDAAQEGVRVARRARRVFREISRDLEKAYGEVKEMEGEERKKEMVMDLIWNSKDAARHQVELCRLDEEVVEFISAERLRVRNNRNKNRSAARRMRERREEERRKGEGTKGTSTSYNGERREREREREPEPAWKRNPAFQSLEQRQEDDREYYAKRGMELHPELGQCDGEPCRKCERKRKEKEEKTAEMEELNMERELNTGDDLDPGPPREDPTDEEWMPEKKEKEGE